MSRDWTEARAKVDREARCRCCGQSGVRLEAAHVIGRKHDDRNGLVHPDDIVPLLQEHHRQYDLGLIDLLPVLTEAEQARAVGHVGILRAWRRITGSGKTDTPSTG